MVLIDAVVLCLGGLHLFRAGHLFDTSCATKFDIRMASLPYVTSSTLNTCFWWTQKHSSISFLSIQVIFWGLVWYKYRRMTSPEIVLEMPPYLPRLFKDGLVVLAVITGKDKWMLPFVQLCFILVMWSRKWVLEFRFLSALLCESIRSPFIREYMFFFYKTLSIWE
jgi:hypothetical protein